MTEQDTREQLTDNFRKNERMDGRVMVIDGAEFADTREKLEEAIVAAIKRTSGIRRDEIIGWLDRQAAITERECVERATSERVGWDCVECAEGLGKELDRRCDPLKARIADLQSQLDEVKAFVQRIMKAVIKGEDFTLFGKDYVPADAYYAAIESAGAIARSAVNLRDEVNQLRKVVQTQAESFKKLELRNKED